jgi:hypothetical protein
MVARVPLQRRRSGFQPGHQWRWKPGQSGNPGGVRALDTETRRACVRAVLDVGVAEMVRIMTTGRNADRINAFVALRDAGLAKLAAMAHADVTPRRLRNISSSMDQAEAANEWAKLIDMDLDQVIDVPAEDDLDRRIRDVLGTS